MIVLIILNNKYDWELKTRDQHIQEMMKHDKIYDMLIIGGGASGAGVALDAASRGLSVALIDKNDFASGTSSRSTKLAHGGIRYLQQIVEREGNVQMSYHLLKEALVERNYFLDSNPFCNTELKIVIPDPSFLRTLFWNYPGTVVYHLIYLITSFKKEFLSSIKGPSIISPRGIRKAFPKVEKIKKYWGTILHEGQFTDSRQCVMTLLTATIDKYELGMKGANIANYINFESFNKDESGKIIGANVCDQLGDKCFRIRAKSVVNCTGVFADNIRLADDPDAYMRMCTSRGKIIKVNILM